MAFGLSDDGLEKILASASVNDEDDDEVGDGGMAYGFQALPPNLPKHEDEDAASSTAAPPSAVPQQLMTAAGVSAPPTEEVPPAPTPAPTLASATADDDVVMLPPLTIVAEQLSARYQLAGNVKQVIDAASAILELDDTSSNLVQRGRQCYVALLRERGSANVPPASEQAVQDEASDSITSQAGAAAAPTSCARIASEGSSPPLTTTAARPAAPGPSSGDDDKWFENLAGVGSVHRLLKCRGVEWAFQYHNFYGDWQLSRDQPLCNGRPHYEHKSLYGGLGHLFHTIDPHHHVPRWVIGPATGNENGWAFCESEAPTPHLITVTWISYDGFDWYECKSLRFVALENEADALESDEFSEDEGEEDERVV
jgi:hypothetical protein